MNLQNVCVTVRRVRDFILSRVGYRTRTAQRIGQHYTNLGRLHGLAKTSSKQCDAKDEDVSKEIQPDGEPSLDQNRDVVCSVFHIQTMFCIPYGTRLSWLIIRLDGKEGKGKSSPVHHKHG